MEVSRQGSSSVRQSLERESSLKARAWKRKDGKRTRTMVGELAAGIIGRIQALAPARDSCAESQVPLRREH